MSQPAPEKILVRNTGTRRLVIGPPAKSKGGGTLVKLDTQADENVPAGKRIGMVRELTGDTAKAVRGSKVVAAVGEKLGLRIA